MPNTLSFGLLLFDKVFPELFGRNFNPQFFWVWKLVWSFFICSLEMVVGPFERKVLTHYRCSLGPLWKEGLHTH